MGFLRGDRVVHKGAAPSKMVQFRWRLLHIRIQRTLEQFGKHVATVSVEISITVFEWKVTYVVHVHCTSS